MPTDSIDNPQFDSGLGYAPTCDTCGKYIAEGDVVVQTFVGRVVKDTQSDELGIVENLYNLTHVGCNRS